MKTSRGFAVVELRLRLPKLNTLNIDLFALDADTPSLVNVASKVYRRVALYEAGTYTATLTYNNGETTTAQWLVRDLETVSKAKNIILFIGVCILSVLFRR